MQKTLEQEIEEVLQEMFLAYRKTLKYEKASINIYVKCILKYYENLDFPLFEETCEVLVLTRNFLPTVNEIADCYDFLHWCKDNGHDSKAQRINQYRRYLDDNRNNSLKALFKLSEYRL